MFWMCQSLSYPDFNFILLAHSPSINETAFPIVLATEAMAVAVVLCSGTNHSADRAGGPPMAIGPAKPFRNWPI